MLSKRPPTLKSLFSTLLKGYIQTTTKNKKIYFQLRKGNWQNYEMIHPFPTVAVASFLCNLKELLHFPKSKTPDMKPKLLSFCQFIFLKLVVDHYFWWPLAFFFFSLDGVKKDLYLIRVHFEFLQNCINY